MKSIIPFLMFLTIISKVTFGESITRGTISNPSNHILIDTEGNRYNVDSLLDEGKHFAIHLISDT